ncbi:Hypothetical protein CAP_2699 [Chondromyces apiculatus DSM 436]|uniref:Uncharacterized protein n=1 Tax=Chondromyces apiculatus DSM 436 TaxID=1192034 RepID=A0A017THT1_9BACT|nr:Hypothetical protein CAP_2699 [Chondromyces apiculatus DSM 436]
MVVGGVALVLGQEHEAGLDLFWAAASGLSFFLFGWAWNERRQARRLARWLVAHEDEIRRVEATWAGQRLTRATTLVQYEVLVSLILVEISFITAPRPDRRPLLPTATTLLLGWWGIPWGPFHTVRALRTNLGGGHTRNVAQLLVALHAKPPPRAAWWRRLLALDTGDRGQIAMNMAVLGIFGAVLLAILIVTILAAFYPGP